MRHYRDDYDIYSVEKGTRTGAKPPKPLNFAEMAEGKDVQAFELTSVTPAQVAAEDIGKAFQQIQRQGGRTVPFVEFAFANSLPLYKPEIESDNENNYFLFWKTQEEPAYVPPLDQIRDKVVRAWKLIKARELARQRAEEYAQQARSLNKPLTELFGSQANLKVTATEPFSWLTLGNIPADPSAQPRLSAVEGVEGAGTDFMESVFSQQAGGVGIALNEPEDTVYVVKVLEFQPPAEALRDQFASENPSRYMSAAADAQRAIYQAWLADLNREADVTWLRQADARRQASTDEEF